MCFTFKSPSVTQLVNQPIKESCKWTNKYHTRVFDENSAKYISFSAAKFLPYDTNLLLPNMSCPLAERTWRRRTSKSSGAPSSVLLRRTSYELTAVTPTSRETTTLTSKSSSESTLRRLYSSFGNKQFSEWLVVIWYTERDMCRIYFNLRITEGQAKCGYWYPILKWQ